MKKNEFSGEAHTITVPATGRILRGLAWYDWRRHRAGAVLGLGSIALMALVIGTIEHPSTAMFFILCMAMGAGCGAGFGRAEWFEGHEEFSLSLPPSRRQRYLVRLTLAFATLAVVYAIGAVACHTTFPRYLLELALGSLPARAGFEPLPAWARGPGFLALSLTAPLAVLAQTFAVSMSVQRRGGLGWAVETLLVALGGLALYLLDRIFLGEAAGWLVSPLLVLFAGFRARLGLTAYERKEAVVDYQPVDDAFNKKATVWILVLLTGLAALGILALWAYKSTRGA